MEAGIYRHYKGGYYQVLGIAEHTETNELMVVYVSLDGAHLPGPRLRVRPLSGKDGWSAHTVHNGDIVHRFQYVGIQIP